MADFVAISKDPEAQAELMRVHTLRMQAHWGKNAKLTPWPHTPADWRQTAYGAPWDTNVLMAIWHRDLAIQISAMLQEYAQK